MEKRLASIDFLRGLALICMIQAHLGVWALADLTGPVVMFGTLLGGMAAPLFLIIVGVCLVLSMQRRRNGGQHVLRRGFLLVILGFVLNALLPELLDLASWGVLQTIGLGIILAYPSLRLSWPVRFLTGLAVVAATPFLQSLPAVGFLPGVLWASWYPVFPWLAYILLGTCIGEGLVRERSEVFWIGVPLLVSGAFLCSIGWPVSLFPASISYVLITSGAALCTFPLVVWLVPEGGLAVPIQRLGQITLTLYFLHLLIGYYLLRGLNLGLPETISLILIFLTACAIAAYFWEKTAYWGGLGWLMRKLSS